MSCTHNLMVLDPTVTVSKAHAFLAWALVNTLHLRLLLHPEESWVQLIQNLHSLG